MLGDLSSPVEQPRLLKAAFHHGEVVSGYFPGSDVPLEVWSCKRLKSGETLEMGECVKSCLGVSWGLQDPGSGDHFGDALPAACKELKQGKASRQVAGAAQASEPKTSHP